MGSLMRQLRKRQCDILINESLLNKTMSIAVDDLVWARRIKAQLKRRRLDLKKFKITPDPDKRKKKKEADTEVSA